METTGTLQGGKHELYEPGNASGIPERRQRRPHKEHDERVMLAPHRFTENGPEGLRLQPYAGRLLQFANGVTVRPNPDYFEKHRTAHGLGQPS